MQKDDLIPVVAEALMIVGVVAVVVVGRRAASRVITKAKRIHIPKVSKA